MSVASKKGTTAVLAEWAAGFRLQDAPADVVERMKALVLDLLRMCAVGARLPWSRSTRQLALQLGNWQQQYPAVGRAYGCGARGFRQRRLRACMRSRR